MAFLAQSTVIYQRRSQVGIWLGQNGRKLFIYKSYEVVDIQHLKFYKSEDLYQMFHSVGTVILQESRNITHRTFKKPCVAVCWVVGSPMNTFCLSQTQSVADTQSTLDAVLMFMFQAGVIDNVYMQSRIYFELIPMITALALLLQQFWSMHR